MASVSPAPPCPQGQSSGEQSTSWSEDTWGRGASFPHQESPVIELLFPPHLTHEETEAQRERRPHVKRWPRTGDSVRCEAGHH